jgi:signal-transduction protein with cAMP-binding, CBS, and nucleotidyltransferase domain
MISHESSSYKVFHSFYEEIQSEFPISVKTKNMFLSLAESITQTLNVTSCYVCGGMSMVNHWPWEAKELNHKSSLIKTILPSHRESV